MTSNPRASTATFRSVHHGKFEGTRRVTPATVFRGETPCD